MKHFDIHPVNRSLETAIQAKIDNLNKPKGALGRLEEIAMQVSLIQESLTPSLAHPCHLLFGGDHGIEREGVSVSPREVTWQQMINFTHGGGGVNMFCRQHGFKLRIVDVGVDYDLSDVEGIIDRKIARGTKNFRYEAAMSEQEFDQAIHVGCEMADDCIAEGCGVLCVGEMGIGNTTTSACVLAALTDKTAADVVGRGGGLNDEGLLTVFFDSSNMGDGEETDIPDYDGRDQNPAPWYRYSEDITAIRIGSDVTGIGQEAFYGFLREVYETYTMKIVHTEDILKILRKHNDSEEMNELIGFYFAISSSR